MIEPTRAGKSRWTRVLALFDGGDVVFIGGLAVACYGVSMWSIPAALVAIGGVLMTIASLPMLISLRARARV